MKKFLAVILSAVLCVSLAACTGSAPEDKTPEETKPANTVNSKADLPGKKIGVQLDTTGNIYVDGEINGWDEETPGVIQNTGASCETLDEAQLAFSKLKAGQIDCVVVDELPAKYLIKNETEYVAYALYYDADTATEEKYGIAVNKNQPELLKAINEVLNELLASKNENGENGVEQLVKKHFGI